MAKAYKKATAGAKAEAKKKKKRSLIGEYYYEEFSTEFWKEPGIYFVIFFFRSCV